MHENLQNVTPEGWLMEVELLEGETLSNSSSLYERGAGLGTGTIGVIASKNMVGT